LTSLTTKICTITYYHNVLVHFLFHDGFIEINYIRHTTHHTTTQGYDVYTPTRNIVFHDDGPNPTKGFDPMGWPRRDVMRNGAIKRLKTLLDMPQGEGVSAQANFGVLGLGKRRTLKQLEAFVGIDLNESTGGKSAECGHETWVPYDFTKTSAMDHLHDHPQDLDPAPEFPRRTVQAHLLLDEIARFAGGGSLTKALVKGGGAPAGVGGGSGSMAQPVAAMGSGAAGKSIVSSPFVLLLLWAAGLGLWYASSFGLLGSGQKRGRSHSNRTRVRRPVARAAGTGDNSGGQQDDHDDDVNGNHKSV
jgi:hypothetical protein